MNKNFFIIEAFLKTKEYNNINKFKLLYSKSSKILNFIKHKENNTFLLTLDNHFLYQNIENITEKLEIIDDNITINLTYNISINNNISLLKKLKEYIINSKKKIYFYFEFDIDKNDLLSENNINNIKSIFEENEYEFRMNLDDNIFINLDIKKFINTLKKLNILDRKIKALPEELNTNFLLFQNKIDIVLELFKEWIKIKKIDKTINNSKILIDFFNIQKKLYFMDKNIEFVLSNENNENNIIDEDTFNIYELFKDKKCKNCVFYDICKNIPKQWNNKKYTLFLKNDDVVDCYGFKYNGKYNEK